MTAHAPRVHGPILRILIVEDNRLISFLLSEMLTDLGHDVCGIERTEDEAVHTAFTTRPDLMIVDSNLAAGTGANTMARVLKSGPMPHVFMSGLPGATPLRGAPALIKPFTADALIRCIADAFLGEFQA